MKASKLIKDLQEIIDKKGDQEVAMELNGCLVSVGKTHYHEGYMGIMQDTMEMIDFETSIELFF